jgi:hypothetical protein
MPLGSVLRQRAGPESSRPLAADVPHALTRPATPASAGHHRSGLRAGRGSRRPWLESGRPGGGRGALWASLFHASFGFASGNRRLSRKKALPYVARRWTWLNQTPAPTAALVRGEKENYNDLAEALSMGLGPLTYSSFLAKGGFWPSPQTWLNGQLVIRVSPSSQAIHHAHRN